MKLERLKLAVLKNEERDKRKVSTCTACSFFWRFSWSQSATSFNAINNALQSQAFLSGLNYEAYGPATLSVTSSAMEFFNVLKSKSVRRLIVFCKNSERLTNMSSFKFQAITLVNQKSQLAGCYPVLFLVLGLLECKGISVSAGLEILIPGKQWWNSGTVRMSYTLSSGNTSSRAIWTHWNYVILINQFAEIIIRAIHLVIILPNTYWIWPTW